MSETLCNRTDRVDPRTTEDILALPHVVRRADVPYLPLPNVVDTVIADVEAPTSLVRTAFALAFLSDGSLVLETNRRRGPEIPGGHVEPGETLEEGARHEMWEETGCTLGDLVPIGFLRMSSEGAVLDDWGYPHPLGAQQFFGALVIDRADYVPNDECLAPTVIPADRIDETLQASDLAFVKAARIVLGLPTPQRTLAP